MLYFFAFFFFNISSGIGESLFPYTITVPFKDATASNSLSLHFQAILVFMSELKFLFSQNYTL